MDELDIKTLNEILLLKDSISWKNALRMVITEGEAMKRELGEGRSTCQIPASP